MGGGHIRITRLEAQQKHNNRVSVFIDGSYAFGLDRLIALTCNLKEGMEVEPRFIENVLQQEELNRGKNYALRLLSYCARSEKEIRERMRQKGYEAQVIEGAIAQLKQAGLIDDRRFAEEFARERMELRRYGRRRVQFELEQKGIARVTIDRVLAGDQDERRRALELARNKLERCGPGDREAIYRKLAGFLQRRGYDYGIITQVLRELLDGE